VCYLYLGEIPSDLGIGPQSSVTEEEVFKGIDKICKQLEIESLWHGILGSNDRRIARQRYDDEVSTGSKQLEAWFVENVIGHRMEVDTSRLDEVKWTRDNAIFADIILRADIYPDEVDFDVAGNITQLDGIPIGPTEVFATSTLQSEKPKRSVLYPVHRAILIRSDYFNTMFSSAFKEAQITEHLQITGVDCSPEVLEVVLTFLYTEKANMPLEIALDVLEAADMLFIEKLKNKAAVVINTIGSGGGSAFIDRTHGGGEKVELIDIYEVMRAAWTYHIQSLESFAARYIAYRLEDYIDEEEFADLIKESAAKIEKRQETDTIELLDE
jgi:ankyrin repeat/BTB/POZ domain-containing protein 1